MTRNKKIISLAIIVVSLMAIGLSIWYLTFYDYEPTGPMGGPGVQGVVVDVSPSAKVITVFDSAEKKEIYLALTDDTKLFDEHRLPVNLSYFQTGFIVEAIGEMTNENSLIPSEVHIIQKRDKSEEAIREFMARPDLELEYMGIRPPANFTVGVITEISRGGYKIETPKEWKRRVWIYQQKEFINDGCEVYEYEVDIRNNEVVQVGIRYPQEGVIPQPKSMEECQNTDTRSLEIPILTMQEIEEAAMSYLRRGVENFDEIKDELVYEGSAKDPKRISAHHAWIWEDKDYKLPEGLEAQAPSEVPTIWSRVSCGGHLIMYLNTVGLFEE